MQNTNSFFPAGVKIMGLSLLGKGINVARKSVTAIHSNSIFTEVKVTS